MFLSPTLAVVRISEHFGTRRMAVVEALVHQQGPLMPASPRLEGAPPGNYLKHAVNLHILVPYQFPDWKGIPENVAYTSQNDAREVKIQTK